MALIPLLEAKGRYFTEPTITSNQKEPYKAGIKPLLTANIERKIAPKAIEGIKYGKKVRLLTQVDSFDPRRFAMEYPANIPTVPAMRLTMTESLRLLVKPSQIEGFRKMPGSLFAISALPAPIQNSVVKLENE